MALEQFCGLNDVISMNQTPEDKEFLEDFQTHMNISNPLQLFLPAQRTPTDLLKNCTVSDTGRPIKFNFQHGTTTLGFIYQGGVVLAVDSRATGGSFIGSQSMKKIVEINDYMLGTLAGGAADCVYWDRVLSKQCRMYELRNRERISVAAASKLMANMIFSYKGYGLSMGMMLGGYDKRGAALYYIDSEGNRTPGKVFSVGSGSIYAYGVLDSGYRWDLTDEEAYDLGRNSIMYATYRDGSSGGIIRVYHITPEGWKHISDEDCTNLIHNRIRPDEF